MKKAIVTTLVFLLTGLAFGQTEFNRAKMDSLFTALESHHKAMGAVSIRCKGRPVYVRGFGYRETEALPNSELTRFRVGSVSKMFTSVLVFQLVEEGKLSLDSKLAEFFPQMPNAEQIRIENLLNHSSGLHNFTDDKVYSKLETKPQTHEQLLKRFAGQKPDFVPGSKHDYSNTNFVLLGYIVEKVTGKPYAEVLETRISKPLELTDTYYGGKTDLQKNECRSFIGQKDTWVISTETDMSIPHGAGSVVSTPVDLGRFLEALFAEKLLKRETLDKMLEVKGDYGHGIFKYPFGKKTAYGHSGSIDGFCTEAAYFPKEELTISLCCNGLSYSLNEIVIGMLSIYFNQPYELPDLKTVSLTPAQLGRCEGTYAATGFPLKITLKAEDGQLRAQATGQQPIIVYARTETEFSNPTYGVVMHMELDGSKVTGFVLKQAGQELPFKRAK